MTPDNQALNISTSRRKLLRLADITLGFANVAVLGLALTVS
jgi:hypothetical protein